MSDVSGVSATRGHVGLTVTNLDRSQHFYSEVFGLTGQRVAGPEGEQGLFLSQDKELVLTLWEQGEGSFSPGMPGLHHLAFEVASRSDVEESLRRIESLGAEVYFGGIASHGEDASSGGIWFTDPDGIRLEISAPSGFDDDLAPSGASPTCGFF